MKLLKFLMFILMFSQPASANIANFWVDKDPDFEDGEEGQMCADALMHGNLLKISGDSWDDYNGNIEFVSFYEGRVYTYFGYSGDLTCNISNHGGGRLYVKGLFDDRGSKTD